MSVSNGKISYRMGKKIGVDSDGDLERAFGTTQHKNQFWYFSDSNTRLNKWARFKPFRNPNIFFDHYTGPNGEQLNPEPARLTAAKAANYGLSAPATQSTPAATLGMTWTYSRPRGSSYNEPCRAMDFEGYNGNAPAPVDPLGDQTISLSAVDSFSFGAAISHNQAELDAIAWEDLPASVGNYYLCVVFSTQAHCTGTLIAKTSTQTIGTNGLVLDITHSELENLQSLGYGYYYIVGISARINNGESMGTPPTSGVDYIALPAPNTSSDLEGEFNIVAATLQTVNLTKVATMQTPTGTSSYSDASDYLGAEIFPVSSSDYLYYNNPNDQTTMPPYYLHLCYHVKASSGSNLTILNPSISLSQTFFSGNGFSTPVSCTLYDSTFQPATGNQIVINAGQEADIYLVASTAALSLYQNGTRDDTSGSQQYFSTTIRLYANNVLIDATNQLRVRNYNF